MSELDELRTELEAARAKHKSAKSAYERAQSALFYACRKLDDAQARYVSHLRNDLKKVEATHFILVKPWAVYVKEADFFRAQNGLTEEWGKDWQPVTANSFEDARAIGERQRLPGRPNATVTEPSKIEERL